MTALIPGDVEAAVERLAQRLTEPGAFRMDDEQRIRTLLASHAALIEQARLDGEALGPFAEYPLSVRFDGSVAPDEYQLTGRHGKDGVFRVITNGHLQAARARLQAREGGGS